MIDIKEQQLVSEFFNQSLTKDHLARAYLLVGNAQQAKFDLVKQINKVLNCIEPNACGRCQNCRWIEANTHPRTPIYLKPDEESRKQVIKVEQIRELQGELSQSSEFFRIVIIEDASSIVLNASSSAALLKTIEEAKANTLFMLFAKSKSSVLSTIVSRSQVLALNDNEPHEYSEEAKLLSQEILSFVNSNQATSRLAQLLKADELSVHENKDLIEALQLLQEQAAIDAVTLAQANLVLAYENAISDLKSFVRPQLVLAAILSFRG